MATGFDALDAQLPGGGWPCGGLTELLQPQASIAEGRLLGPALARLAADGQRVVLIGPPKPPHPPGLHQAGIDPSRLLWVQAETPAERCWCAEQVVAAGGCAIVVWLPQARPMQLRRLHLAALDSGSLLIACRPAEAAREASAATLRLHAALGADGGVEVRVLKRRGPTYDGVLALRAMPDRLEAVLVTASRPPQGFLPARPDAAPETAHAADAPVVDRPAVASVAVH